MHKFYVGQPVKIGPGAEIGVGCLGRIKSVSLGVCEVEVNFPSGKSDRVYLTTELIPAEDGVTA